MILYTIYSDIIYIDENKWYFDQFGDGRLEGPCSFA